jgi:hypothetical protein
VVVEFTDTLISCKLKYNFKGRLIKSTLVNALRIDIVAKWTALTKTSLGGYSGGLDGELHVVQELPIYPVLLHIY